MRKVQYSDENERQFIIQAAIANGEILTEESNLIDGNFLTFCTKDEVAPIVEQVIKQDDYLLSLDYRLSILERMVTNGTNV